MESLTVTIGRGIGTTGATLPDSAWGAFRADVREAAESIGATVVAANDGRGEWEGIVEDNHVLVAIHDAITGQRAGALRSRLAELATGYRQDAIALAIGQSELVESASTGQTVAFQASTELTQSI